MPPKSKIWLVRCFKLYSQIFKCTLFKNQVILLHNHNVIIKTRTFDIHTLLLCDLQSRLKIFSYPIVSFIANFSPGNPKQDYTMHLVIKFFKYILLWNSSLAFLCLKWPWHIWKNTAIYFIESPSI